MSDDAKERLKMARVRLTNAIERQHMCGHRVVSLDLTPAEADDILDLLDEGEAVEVEVVCLCGSTRFADHHAIRRWELEQAGQGRTVVMMINYLPAWWAEEQGWDGNDHFGERTGTKEMLDELHLRKIDLSDRVHVVNPGGYVGESTAREIVYARKAGKPVTFDEGELNGPGVAILAEKEEDEKEGPAERVKVLAFAGSQPTLMMQRVALLEAIRKVREGEDS